VELIASGAQADVYKDGSRAIKLFRYNIQKENVEYEVNTQSIAFDYGLPVPKIYDTIEINGKLGIIMEYIDGIPVGKIISRNIFKLKKYLKKSIEIQNDIHKIETNKLSPMKNILNNYVLQTNKLADIEKEKILTKMDKMSFENRLCHGDFHVFNLIQTSTEVKIIDWICASSGNPEADIYRTHLLYKLFNKYVANIYLDTYCKLFCKDKQKILEWSSIIAGARLGEYIKNEKEEKKLRNILNNTMN
jgi:tRNA A-37 threonylcarbamoyl transferase component Bud32